MRKEIPTSALASLTTGILLCDFGEVHSAAEYILGHSIYTHELVIVFPEIKTIILTQHSDLPTVGPSENYEEFVKELENKFGKTLSIAVAIAARDETLRKTQ